MCGGEETDQSFVRRAPKRIPVENGSEFIREQVELTSQEVAAPLRSKIKHCVH